ncbi:hypothetical protein WG66_011849 [Moniliophthora roreri]|uniref:Uncharacterized protein n=1 Tax=Moniliophthora roreri TaxID=221103 RepID=A0A0W0F2C3_MONRR|nr:hypothetical protein WG66_011849 [Moniliophthora roreri]
MAETQDLRKTIDTFMERHRCYIVDFVCGRKERNKGLWTYDSDRIGELDARVAEFLRELRLPSSPKDPGSPSLLFHDLTVLKSDSLTQSLTNVFRLREGKHMLLVNVSGSGKTRIVLEGLSRNWGFYFICQDDGTSIGSQDLPIAMQHRLKNHPLFKEILPEDPSSSDVLKDQLAYNCDIANRIFAEVLLARLVVFEQFLDSMKLDMEKPENRDCGISTYRERWLTLQARPGLLECDDDIFASLVEAMHLESQSLQTLKSEVSRVRDSILKKLAVYDTSRFFLVIDEAQVAATTFPHAFRSAEQNLKGGVGRKDRPVLRQIIHGWTELLKVSATKTCASYVITGTGVSLLDITEAVASSTGKKSGFATAYLTGAFDSAEDQRAYIEKYIPEVILNSEIGKILAERMWFWFRGRQALFYMMCYRQLTLLPLTLLNIFIKHYADFTPMDCSESVLSRQNRFPLLHRDIEHSMDVFPLDFGTLEKAHRLRKKVVEIAYESFISSYYQGSLGTDEKQLVNLGFARYAAKSLQASIDERLIIIACVVWANKGDIECDTLYQYLCDELPKSIPVSDSANGFEHYLAYYFALVFREYTALNVVFDFLDHNAPLRNRSAKLVALHRTIWDGVTGYDEGVTQILGDEPISQCVGNLGRAHNKMKESDFMRWLRFKHREAFFFPKRSATGDLIFVLKLSRTNEEPASYIWVSVQAKLHTGNPRADGNLYLSNDVLHHAIKTITPRRFFVNKDAPDIPLPRVSQLNLMGDRDYASSSDGEDDHAMEDDDDHDDQDRPDERNEVLGAMWKLPRRADENTAGRFSCLRVVASWPAIVEFSELEAKYNKDGTQNKRRIVWSDPDKNDGHPLAVLNRRTFVDHTSNLSPSNFLTAYEDDRKTEAFMRGVTAEDQIYESQEVAKSKELKGRAARSSKTSPASRKKATRTVEKVKKVSEARKGKALVKVDNGNAPQLVRRSKRLERRGAKVGDVEMLDSDIRDHEMDSS